MDNRNNSGGGGFLFGLLIGGGLVFLLGTDKGRKILKSLTEEGFGEISQMLEKAEGELIEEEEPAPKKARIIEDEEVVSPSSNGHSAPVATKKRFFRRAPKS